MLFHRSAAKHALVYSTFLADGDSSILAQFRRSRPYQQYGVEVRKIQCCLHAAKRFKRRVNSLKTHLTRRDPRLKALVFGILGTNNWPVRIQNALVNIFTTGDRDPEHIRQRLQGRFDHWRSSDENPFHDNCDKAICRYWAVSTIPHTHTVRYHPGPVVMEVLKPILESFWETNFLHSISHGLTTNSSESFNSLLWSLIHKELNFSLPQLILGCNLAVILWNQGDAAMVELWGELGIEIGRNCLDMVRKRDERRCYLAEYKASPAAKRRRTELQVVSRRNVGGSQDYQAGGFV